MSTTVGEHQALQDEERQSVSAETADSDGHNLPMRSRRSQFLAACLFWSFCLTLTAAGHRLYKATVAVDREVSAETYRTGGAPLNWVGRGSVELYAKYLLPAGESIEPASLTVLPHSPFLLGAAAFYTVLAFGLIWAGRGISHDGIQSLLGLFAGHFLWLGAIEFGLDAAGRYLGLAGSLEVIAGRLVGTHGGGVLIQLSAVFLIPMLIGWTFHESNRCVVFQWFRRRLPLVRSIAPSGRVDNYAARTAIQYFMTVWFCYVSVLWLADPRMGQFGQYGLLMTMAAIALATPYMMWRTANQPGRSPALRYSVSGTIMTWTGIEIAAALRMIHEPWLSNSLSSALVFLGMSIGLTFLVWQMLTTGRSSLANSRLRTVSGLIVLGFILAGCEKTEPESTLSPAEIESRLRDYDSRIKAPPPTAHDGLLHALSSDDPTSRANAALAFGKSSRVTAAVTTRLREMAADDSKRLPQFAALTALQRLKLLTPSLLQLIQHYQDDPKWRPVVRFAMNPVH